jgi:3-oxoadipate enol-lactonase
LTRYHRSAGQDRVAQPRFGQELARLIPGARYVEIADAGHGVTIQRRDTVNDLLDEHLTSAEGSSVTPP